MRTSLIPENNLRTWGATQRSPLRAVKRDNEHRFVDRVVVTVNNNRYYVDFTLFANARTCVCRDNSYSAGVDFDISAYGIELPKKRSTNREFFSSGCFVCFCVHGTQDLFFHRLSKKIIFDGGT
jgi:hypothetical protein